GSGAQVGNNAYSSVAVGSNAKVLADAISGVAIGSGATATHHDDVALGAGATTEVQHTGNFTIDGSTAAGLNSGAAVVSVGSAGNERQIQNVAPGVLSSSSTDAVNGSQLYATNQAIDNVSTVA